MPLLAVPFAGGLDTKTDPRQTPVARLQVLENASFINPQSLRKRFGYDALPRDIAGGGTITDGQALMAFREELVQCDPSRLYSFESATSKWVDKGALLSVGVTQAPIVRNTYEQTQQDGVQHPTGLECFAWEDSSGGIRYALRDSTTGQVVVASALLSSTGLKPKTLAVGNFFCIWYVDTVASVKALQLATIPVLTPTQAPVITTMTAVAGTVLKLNQSFYTYDAEAFAAVGANPALMYVVFGASVGGWTVRAYDPSNVTTPLQTLSVTFGAAVKVVTVFQDLNTGGPIVAWWAPVLPAGGITGRAYTPFTSSATPTLAGILTLAGPSGVADVQTLSGAGSSSAVPGTCTVWWGSYNAIGGAYSTSVNTAVNYTTGVHKVLTLAGFLCGKAFLAPNGRTYAPILYSSPLDSTLFVMGDDGALIVRTLSGLAGALPVRDDGQFPMLPQSSSADGETWLTTQLVQDMLTTLPVTTTIDTPTTATFTQTGVVVVLLDFAAGPTSYQRTTLAGSLFVNGGFLQQYDGATVVEAGFHVYPELTAANGTTSNTGGALGNASQATTYWTCFTYQWVDNTGAVQISAPSVPVMLGFGSSVVTGKITWAVPTLRLTAKSGVTLSAWRTVGVDPGVFYLCQTTQVPAASGGVNAPILNDTTVDTVTFVDELSDADIIGNPRLYSTGGVLENEAPPPFAAMVVFQNRLWGIDSTNPTTLWYSQEVIPGQPVQFSSFLTFNLDPAIGAATALGVIDGNLVAYGATTAFYTLGQGPDSTGNNNQYQDFQEVNTEVGCINPRSIVRTPAGLVSQSEKGLYLLDRSLVAMYIGAPVEGLVNGQTVTSSLLVPTKNEIRHTLDSDRAVFLDTFVGQWGSHSPLGAVDACIWQKQFTWLRADGTVMQETPDEYSDAGQAIQLSLLTAPIRLGVISGFQRARELIIYGAYESPHDLEVTISYVTGEATAPQTEIVSPTSPGTWGDTTPWGADPFWGGSYQPYMWRIELNTQKCESLQVAIKDVQNGVTPGQGMILSSLAFEVVLKKGLLKLPASATYG